MAKQNISTITPGAFVLPPRVRDAHKNQFGHILVVGGDCGMSGAPRLAALGALRVGAGLVTIATKPRHAPFMNLFQPEIMSRGVKNGKDLGPLLKKATVVVVGPGLGQSAWAQSLLKKILVANLPVIMDADALNMLAKHSARNKHWILTPHVGEAARLLKTNTKMIQQDRQSAALSIQKQYDGVCVLKGAGTIVADEEQHLSICELGNPGMASGGMGDLLSGIIAGLLAQGLSLSQAAKMGVYIHAKAGDMAAKKGERGLITTDLLPFIRELVNHGN